MTDLKRSLWYDPVDQPFLRLAVALICAPLVLAAILTGLAYLVAGSSETTRAGTLAVTNEAATAFFVYIPAYSLTVGLAGVMLIWVRGWREMFAWLAIGAGSGALAYTGLSLAAGRPLAPLHLAIAAVLSLILFWLIRCIARVRTED